MEKKGDPTSVVMGYDDAQSTYSMDQPPPAYKKPEAPSVKIAKLIAATVFALSLVIGAVVLAAVYIQSKNQCIIIPQTVPFETLTAAESVPIAEALHQSQVPNDHAQVDSHEENSIAPDSDKIHIPLQLNLDELAGHMMENNQRARMSCLIEKKKAEEIVTQTPKHLRTPFGNLTTDQRYVHVSGESMSLSCRTGNARMMRPMSKEDMQPQQTNDIMQSRMHMQPQMPQMQMQQMQQIRMQPPQHHPQHPMMGGPPHLMMGPGGAPMPPAPQALVMDLHGFREPRSDHMRVKRQLKQCDCACEC